MPPRGTTITSERARELGRKGAAAVDRDPVTHRFVKRATPADPPVAEPELAPAPDPAPPPAPVVAEPPAPSFRIARAGFRRRRPRA